MTEQYLYGLTIHGIQRFIFETGKLKEIVGGSEFVEQVCGKLFQEAVESIGKYNKDNLIVSAAGKVIYLFEEAASCQHIATTYVKNIKEKIPELTIVQAAVSLNRRTMRDALELLDERLETQRSRMPTPHGMGLIISERARRTGKPGVKEDQDSDNPDALLDRSQVVKQAFSGKNTLIEKIAPNQGITFPTDLEELAKEGNWIAVIHADGNSMGKIVQGLLREAEEQKKDVRNLLSKFSKKINEATQKATQSAFKQVVLPSTDLSKEEPPLRPLLLGGDDLSLIIRADLALDFTHIFLQQFEANTKTLYSELGIPSLKNGLTACAGIAYIKRNYPIHYGMTLAESMSSYAKKVAKAVSGKESTPSCIAFHKVQSSFVEDYEEIIKRVLTADDNKTGNAIRFDYGPYFLQPVSYGEVTYPSISDLLNWATEINKADAPKSNLRNWLATLHRNRPDADRLMKCILNRKGDYIKTLHLSDGNSFQWRVVKENGKTEQKEFTHIHDALIIASLIKTKA